MLVGYARVSTQDQNLDLQIKALQEAGCKKIFTEKASGFARERPELKKAMEYIREGEDSLVVWKLDRLARSLKQLITTVENLNAMNIGLESIIESINTKSSGGKFIFHIFGALAEFERSIIKDRTKAGLAAAKARGKLPGRPGLLNKEDLEVAEALLKKKKISVVNVAKRVGVSAATLYRYFPGGRADLIIDKEDEN